MKSNETFTTQPAWVLKQGTTRKSSNQQEQGIWYNHIQNTRELEATGTNQVMKFGNLIDHDHHSQFRTITFCISALDARSSNHTSWLSCRRASRKCDIMLFLGGNLDLSTYTGSRCRVAEASLCPCQAFWCVARRWYLSVDKSIVRNSDNFLKRLLYRFRSINKPFQVLVEVGQVVLPLLIVCNEALLLLK